MGRVVGLIVRGIWRLAWSLFLIVALVGFALIDDQPSVAKGAPLTSKEVVAAQAFAQEAKAALDPANPTSFISTDLDQLNGVISLASRLIPGLRGQAKIDKGDLTGRISIPVPYVANKWINFSARVPSFEGQLVLKDVTLGSLPLPSRLTLEVVRTTANQTLGSETGDRLLNMASALRIEEPAITLMIDQEASRTIGNNGSMRQLFGALQGGNPPKPEDIARYYAALRQAMNTGALPRNGSFLPYLRFTLELVRKEVMNGAEIAEAYTAAIFALNLACGAPEITRVIGGLDNELEGVQTRRDRSCNTLTLNGRIDSRRHFTAAAAIQAASNRGVAVSLGEFKELFDSQKAGGFDFSDIAANNSGIRLSKRLMAASVQSWGDLLLRIQDERDVIISYGDIPKIMSARDFEHIYGAIDDPRYLAMLDQIEAKIDQLSLHKE